MTTCTRARRRYTSHEELTRLLMRAGFSQHKCAHRNPLHESWERRPNSGTSPGSAPLFVVHLRAPHKDTPRRGVIADGFAFGGPRESDEHWAGRFASLTAAADWAAAHGRRVAA